MSLILKRNTRQYELCPEGLHQAVLADVVDRGERQTKFGAKQQVMLVFLTGTKDRDGEPFRLFYFANASLHPDAKLASVIKKLTGSLPGDSFDLESLIGANARLVVNHTEREGQQYASVASVLSVDPQDPQLVVPADFTRQKDKEFFAKNPSTSTGNPWAGVTESIAVSK